MALLRNKAFKNKELVTSFGTIVFDENGEATVEDNAGEKLGTLKGFELVSQEVNQGEDEKQQDGANTDAEDEVEEEESMENEAEETSEADDEVETIEEEEMGEAELLENLEETGTPDFDAFTVAELTKYAKENKIDLGKATKKADIIKAIEKATK